MDRVNSKGDEPEEEDSDEPAANHPENDALQEGAENLLESNDKKNCGEEQSTHGNDFNSDSSEEDGSTSWQYKPPRLTFQKIFEENMKKIQWFSSVVEEQSQIVTNEETKPSSFDLDVSPQDDTKFATELSGQKENPSSEVNIDNQSPHVDQNFPNEAASNLNIEETSKLKKVDEVDICEPGTSTGITEQMSMEHHAKKIRSDDWITICRAEIAARAQWSSNPDSSSLEDIPNTAMILDEPNALPADSSSLEDIPNTAMILNEPSALPADSSSLEDIPNTAMILDETNALPEPNALPADLFSDEGPCYEKTKHVKRKDSDMEMSSRSTIHFSSDEASLDDPDLSGEVPASAQVSANSDYEEEFGLKKILDEIDSDECSSSNDQITNTCTPNSKPSFEKWIELCKAELGEQSYLQTSLEDLSIWDPFLEKSPQKENVPHPFAVHEIYLNQSDTLPHTTETPSEEFHDGGISFEEWIKSNPIQPNFSCLAEHGESSPSSVNGPPREREFPHTTECPSEQFYNQRISFEEWIKANPIQPNFPDLTEYGESSPSSVHGPPRERDFPQTTECPSEQFHDGRISFEEWIKSNPIQPNFPHLAEHGESSPSSVSRPPRKRELLCGPLPLLEKMSRRKRPRDKFKPKSLFSESDTPVERNSNFSDEAAANLEGSSEDKEYQVNLYVPSVSSDTTIRMPKKFYARLISYNKWISGVTKSAFSGIVPKFTLQKSSTEDANRERRESSHPSADETHSSSEQKPFEEQKTKDASCQTEATIWSQEELIQRSQVGGDGDFHFRERQNNQGQIEFNIRYNFRGARGRERIFCRSSGVRGKRQVHTESGLHDESGAEASNEASSRGKKNVQSKGRSRDRKEQLDKDTSYDDSSTSDDKGPAHLRERWQP